MSHLVYHDLGLDVVIVAPKFFVSNYASIPEIIPKWILDADSPIIRDISVIHDFIYSNSCKLVVSRNHADMVLYRGMRDLGAGWIISQLAYMSVRVCGSGYWRND